MCYHAISDNSADTQADIDAYALDTSPNAGTNPCTHIVANSCAVTCATPTPYALSDACALARTDHGPNTCAKPCANAAAGMGANRRHSRCARAIAFDYTRW